MISALLTKTVTEIITLTTEQESFYNNNLTVIARHSSYITNH